MLKEVFLNTDVVTALDLFSLCPNFLKVTNCFQKLSQYLILKKMKIII